MTEECGFCLNPGDYDAPVLYQERIVRARKPYNCCECGRCIEPGQQYQKTTGMWDGEWYAHYTCLDCMHIRDAFRCGGGFLFGQLWDSLYEYRNDVNTACVAKIKTVSSKQRYMDWLREARGIDA